MLLRFVFHAAFFLRLCCPHCLESEYEVLSRHRGSKVIKMVKCNYLCLHTTLGPDTAGQVDGGANLCQIDTKLNTFHPLCLLSALLRHCAGTAWLPWLLANWQSQHNESVVKSSIIARVSKYPQPLGPAHSWWCDPSWKTINSLLLVLLARARGEPGQ